MSEGKAVPTGEDGEHEVSDWLAGVDTAEPCVWDGPQARGNRLRQVPTSPGRQFEQGVPPLTQAQRKHLAVPLHRQQRIKQRRESDRGKDAITTFQISKTKL